MTSDLTLLTGDDAGELLAAAVTTAGGELVDWSVKQVDHRPGRSTTVAYRADVRWADGVRRLTLGASVGRPGDARAPGVLEMADGERTAAVWMFPSDPELPALRLAYDPESVSELLADLGASEASRGPVRLDVRAYRPTRRAVIEASTPGARVFLKVVRPSRVAELHARHALLADAGLPVPRPLGWSDQGLLVLAPLTGDSMRVALQRGDPVPTAQEILALLDRLPAGVTELPRRTAWSEHATHYASVIGAALPAEADRAARLADGVEHRIAGIRGDEPTHGDLYESQILLHEGRVTGLLDVDTAGPGRRADDLACLVAHLETLALLRGWDSARLHLLALEYARTFATAVDPGELRARTAGVLLSLATGPHRVQEQGWEAATTRRLDAVEQWLDGDPAR
ncbi:phosphotransferase [Isoptericola variabilis]|uniref:phosphotransferase n=1 Tax=Isoptericola variabilis TaxID=139208 RepID=UPI00030B5EEC|nr:phosphotransferase [Isoptericola variabilis]